jgi:poly(3-hydroxybutyrate) depolymerase
MEWFEQNLISHVPFPHRGFMRRVYPGFVQVSAFLAMNPERHQQSFRDMYRHLVDGAVDEAHDIQEFYEEYLAVNDLPAEFYLETVEKVFQTYDLPLGKLSYKDRIVQPAAIQRTALMTVEGERDDICAVGQTSAAHDLCTNIAPAMRTQHVQSGVGHYGVFSGRRWNQEIYPRVREMIHASNG